MSIDKFRGAVYAHYRKYGRTWLPWRHTKNPYHILVSEVMLQQTQVSRVMGKYEEFLCAFPDVRDLAKAPLKKILRVWQGMGYNRRAQFLKSAAQAVAERHGGKIPDDEKELRGLPGVGPATAAGIMAFAYNKPAVYLETNIRSAIIHHFFPGKKMVHDRDVARIVAETTDARNSREWYSALLDYGAALKGKSNPSRRSTHYARESPFKGSERELRGKIVRLLAKKWREEKELRALLRDKRLGMVLEKLEKEEMIKRRGNIYSI